MAPPDQDVPADERDPKEAEPWIFLPLRLFGHF